MNLTQIAWGATGARSVSRWALPSTPKWFIFGARIYHARPLSDPFFPQLLQQLPVAIFAYLAPVLLALFALLRPKVVLLRAALPLWPSRPALCFAIVGLQSLMLLNNVLLTSVIAGPVALAAAALYLLRTEGPAPAHSPAVPDMHLDGASI